MKTLSVGRVGVAAMSLGIAQEAVDLAVSHTKNRSSSAAPVQKPGRRLYAGRYGDPAQRRPRPGISRRLAHGQRRPADKAASMAKVLCRRGRRLHRQPVPSAPRRLRLPREYEIERLYRDVRITSIYEGSSQVQQMVISGAMLK